MSKNTKRAARAALIVSLLAAADARAATGRAFFWEATRGGRTHYLLGSFHLATKDMYPLPKPIEQAFARSRVVVAEARVDKVGPALQAQILRQGMYTPPDDLSKHLSKRTLKLALAAGDQAGVPAMALTRMKPWMVATMISLAAIKRLGFDEKRGIEMHFFGKLGSRRVVELEGALAQIKMLSGFSAAQQEAFLLYTLQQVKTVKTEMGKMVRAWKSGNHRAMSRLLTKQLKRTPKLRAIYKTLVTERNLTMTRKIDKLFRSEKGPCFVIVGAAHLVGPRGIIALLKKKGHRLKQR